MVSVSDPPVATVEPAAGLWVRTVPPLKFGAMLRPLFCAMALADARGCPTTFGTVTFMVSVSDQPVATVAPAVGLWVRTAPAVKFGAVLRRLFSTIALAD